MDEGAVDKESPWRVPTDDSRRVVTRELLAEVAPGHPLHGREIEVAARCRTCDEVLVRVGEGDFGLVHLTWSGKHERPPYPRYIDTGGFLATEIAANAHSAKHELP